MRKLVKSDKMSNSELDLQTEEGILKQRHVDIRLDEMLLVPYLFQCAVNSGDFEHLTHILTKSFDENCESNSLTMNPAIRGRAAIYEYQAILFKIVPDFILNLDNKIFHEGIISCYYSTKGTGLTIHKPDLLWHCISYGMKTYSEEVQKQKLKFDAYVNQRIFFEFKGKVIINLILNETWTQIASFMLIPTSIEVLDSRLPLLG